MNIEKTFHSKIDWTFYNTLVKLTNNFRTLGYIPIISICTKSINNSYEKIYESENGYFEDNNLNVLDYWHEKYGLFYRVEVVGIIDDIFTKDLFLKLRGQAIRTFDKHKNILTIKPIVLHNE